MTVPTKPEPEPSLRLSLPRAQRSMSRILSSSRADRGKYNVPNFDAFPVIHSSIIHQNSSFSTETPPVETKADGKIQIDKYVQLNYELWYFLKKTRMS